MLMTVDFSNLYANDTDYCDSPDTKNRNVRDNLSPAEVSSLKFVDCFVINGFNMFSRWSNRSGDIRI